MIARSRLVPPIRDRADVITIRLVRSGPTITYNARSRASEPNAMGATFRRFVWPPSLPDRGVVGCDRTTAQQHFDRGQSFVAADDPRSAIIEFKNALQKDPNFAVARLALVKRTHDRRLPVGGEGTRTRTRPRRGSAAVMAPLLEARLAVRPLPGRARRIARPRAVSARRRDPGARALDGRRHDAGDRRVSPGARGGPAGIGCIRRARPDCARRERSGCGLGIARTSGDRQFAQSRCTVEARRSARDARTPRRSEGGIRRRGQTAQMDILARAGHRSRADPEQPARRRRQCGGQGARRAPTTPMGNYFKGLIAFQKQDYVAAENALRIVQTRRPIMRRRCC